MIWVAVPFLQRSRAQCAVVLADDFGAILECADMATSTLAVERTSSTPLAITALVAGILLLPLGLFGPDLAAGLIYLAVDGHYDFVFRKHSGIAVALVFLAILVLRGLVLWTYARWASRRCMFGISFRWDRRTWSWMAASLVLAAGLIWLDRTVSPQPKHVPLLAAFTSYWGRGFGLANTILQFVYYFSEGLAMIWMADAFQTAGEARVRVWIPWGGIALALLWGGGHLFSKDLTTAVALLLPGLVIGVVYSLSQKRLWAAQALFFALTLPELFK